MAMSKAEMAAEIERLKAQIAGGSRPAKVPGFNVLPADAYCKAKAERILADGSEIVYTISQDGFLGCTMNLRFKGKRPIPGIGGKGKRWTAYRNYWRSSDFDADLKWAAANGATNG